MFENVDGFAERQTHISFSGGTEHRAGNDEYVRFVEDAVGERFGIGCSLRYASPKEKTLLFACAVAVQGFHDFACNGLAPGVLRVERFVPFRAGLQCGYSAVDDGEGLAGIDIAFYPQDVAYEFGVGNEHPDAPSGHVQAFAQ